MIRYTADLDLMQPGPAVVVGMPASVYHAIDRVSASLLAEFHVDEAEGDLYLRTPREPETMDMAFGTAFHAALLEPEDYAARKLVRNDIGPSAKVGMREAQQANPGRIILARGWEAQIAGIQAKCREHPAVSEIILSDIGRRAFKEVVLLWSETVYGDTVLCKARLDYWHQDWSLCADIKTTNSAKRIDFERLLPKLAYPLKAAWYLRGVRQCGLAARPDFAWLPMERDAPHRVNAIGAAERCLHQGWGEASFALHTLIGYLRRGRTLATPPPRIEEGGDIPVYERVPDEVFAQFTDALDQPTLTHTPEETATWTTSKNINVNPQAAETPNSNDAANSSPGSSREPPAPNC